MLQLVGSDSGKDRIEGSGSYNISASDVYECRAMKFGQAMSGK